MSEQNIQNPRNTIGIGVIIIPEGVNRENYIQNCFNKE